MWAALTKTLAQDLGEFANVVSTDAQTAVSRLGGGDVFAGDENTSLVAVAPDVDPSAIADLQSAPETYAEEFVAPDEIAMAASADFLAEVTTQTVRQDLLAKSDTVDSMHKRFVIGASENDPEATVPEDLFFHRYFVRLAVLRQRFKAEQVREEQRFRAEEDRRAAAAAEQQKSVAAAEKSTAVAAASATQQGGGYQDPMFSGWGGSSPVKPSGAGDSTGALADDERRGYEEHIAELERVIGVLSSQVQHLSNEKEAAQRALAKAEQALDAERKANADRASTQPAVAPQPTQVVPVVESAARPVASPVRPAAPAPAASTPQPAAQAHTPAAVNAVASPTAVSPSPLTAVTRPAVAQSPPRTPLAATNVSSPMLAAPAPTPVAAPAPASPVTVAPAQGQAVPMNTLGSPVNGSPTVAEAKAAPTSPMQDTAASAGSHAAVQSAVSVTAAAPAAVATAAPLARAAPAAAPRPIAPLPAVNNDEGLDEEWATIA